MRRETFERTAVRGEALFLAVLAAGIAGCATPPAKPTVHVSSELLSRRSLAVAVLPFDRGVPRQDYNNTWSILASVKDAGKLVSDMFATELMRVPNFRLVERSQIKSVLSELNLSLSDLIEQKSAQQIGELLGVDAVLVGHVASFWYQQHWTQEKWSNYSYSVRLVETKSGIVLFTASVSEHNRMTDDTSSLCQQAVKAVVDELVTQLSAESNP